MQRPSASATASRFAAHWVADALAADDALDFSSVMALLDASRESLAGAPESVTERVALRCLQELSAATTGDGPTASRAPPGILRVDITRSCEDLLLQIIGEVGTSGSSRKDMLPTFSQDIQNIICIKKPRLPETCFELLREVDREIVCMALPFPVEQNGDNKRDHLNIVESRFPTDNAKLHLNLANLVNQTEKEKDSIEPTCVLQEQIISDTRYYKHLQEDVIGNVGVGAKSPENSPTNVEGNMPAADVPASASCNAALHGTITELLSNHDSVDHTTMVQQQSCRGKSPNLSHCNDVVRPPDGSSNQSFKSSMKVIIAPALHRSSDVLPTNTSEASHLPEFATAHDTTIIPRVNSSKTHPSSPQYGSSDKANQDLVYEGTSIQPVEKDSIHEELALQAGGVLPSVRCNDATQGDKSETNHLLGNSKEHTALYDQPNDSNCHLEVSGADKVDQSIFSDGGILEKNMALCGELNGQSSSEPRSCSVALHNKISEDNSLSEQNNAKRTDVQKLSCSITVPIPPWDGDGRRAKEISNKETLLVETSHVHSSDDSLNAFADKMSFCIKDQGTNRFPRGCSEKDLCIKCGKEGQLLKCNSCLLAAHESCFGQSVIFEDSDEFCCPVCFYTKATEAYKEAKNTYCEARKNLAAFLGTQPLVNQHDEQLPEVQPTEPRASASNLNGYGSKNIHRTETHKLACLDEKDDQQRKKQKINAPVDACPEEGVTGKAPCVRNSDVEHMNKHSVLQNISKKVDDSEKEHRVETTKSPEEARNKNSCDRRGNTYHEKCGPSATNQEVEADKEDDLTNSNQSENSGETEARSLNGSSQRSLPHLHNIRHHKARSCNSRKAFVHQGEHMPSPSRKRNYAYPVNRLSGPIAPTGRRSKLSWTDEEETALREAMEKFNPRDNMPIPWVQILEYGRDVFNRARLPSDLRVKWRNMMKKAGS